MWLTSSEHVPFFGLWWLDIISSQNVLYLWFLFVISAARRSCNIRGKDNVIRLNDLSGYLNLPNQTDNLSCTWIITVPEGNLVMLKTHYYSLFDNSSVQIRDGQDSSSEILETYAGDGTKKVSYTVISSGRHLWARFQSFREKFNLFLAKYEAVKNSKAETRLECSCSWVIFNWVS